MSWNKVNQVRKWCKGRKLSVTRRLFFIEIQLLDFEDVLFAMDFLPVSYTHLRAHETGRNLVCRLLLEKKKKHKLTKDHK